MKKQPARQTTFWILHHFDEMRHPYNQALSPFCSKVKWFSSLKSLMSSVEMPPPQMVIIDVDRLPNPVDTALEEIRNRLQNSELIALSSLDSSLLAAKCFRLGFSDYLLKPTSPEELGWSVQQVLEGRQIFRSTDTLQVSTWKVVTQISACQTDDSIRTTTLQHLKMLLAATGISWVEKARLQEDPSTRYISLSGPPIPKNISSSLRPSRSPFQRIHDPGKRSRMICIPATQGTIVAWGIPKSIGKLVINTAVSLVKHAELCMERLKKYEEIKNQTFIDDLTGLYNSRYLRFALSHAILRSRQATQTFSVLFIDVDHFKTVNDAHGHLVGSEFLIAVGKTIRNAVRSIDPVFRYGGDEFVVILLDTPIDGAHEIGERIRKNIERRVFVIKNQEVRTTVSIGIANYPIHTKDRNALLEIADSAMYCAKKQARNSVYIALMPPAKPSPSQHEPIATLD